MLTPDYMPLLKPLNLMDELELDDAYRLAVFYDEVMLYAFYGFNGARRYKQLERTCESLYTPWETFYAATAGLEAMQERLSPEERDYLFGIGDPLSIPEPYEVADELRRRGLSKPEAHRMLSSVLSLRN